MSTKAIPLSYPFVWKRLHSLFGFWIVLFLIEHLVTNSQAALLIGADGEGFIRAVNFLKNLPYLPVIEIVLLGVPIAFHMLLGIKYLMTSKMNAYPSSGKKPALPNYGRNQAYSWQRITSWVLLIGIIAHVGYMRFYMYPTAVNFGQESIYFVRISMDPGLYGVSDRLGVSLYNQKKIDEVKKLVEMQTKEIETLSKQVEMIEEAPPPYVYQKNSDELLHLYQSLEEKKEYLRGLETRSISGNEVIASAPDFGTATLLVVRDSFKSVFKSILYTLFVLAAVFHAFNGLWTFMLTWGIVLKMRSQSMAVNVCVGIMILIGFLGLASVWGTYYLNLRS